jgi:hypothetical protein
LRIAHFGGHFTPAQYDLEQNLVREMIRTEMTENGKDHLQDFLDEWERLESYRNQGRVVGHPVG